MSQSLLDRYDDLLRHHRNDGKAATALMREINAAEPALFDRLNSLAEEATFTCRHYGGGQFYCWADHDILPTLDPWPASRYPKAVLCVEFLRVLH